MAFCSYRELIVWQKAMDLVDEVYLLVKELPKENSSLYQISCAGPLFPFPQISPKGKDETPEKTLYSFFPLHAGLYLK